MIILFALSLLLGPGLLLVSVCWCRPIMDRIEKLELQQPPAWIRHVMGLKFSPIKAFLFAWTYGPVIVIALAFRRIRSWFCRHDFSGTWAEFFYCEKCLRWKHSDGFYE